MLPRTTAREPCPLCENAATSDFVIDRGRRYVHCHRCDLVFLPAKYHLSTADQRAHYDQHRNIVSDPAYRAFLNRLFAPLSAMLHDSSEGLDFGCGPGPALAEMFRESGHAMHVFDPHYAPDPTRLQQQYDFITTTEVLEHLSDPCRELRRLWNLLKPDGLLGIMTLRRNPDVPFPQWHYRLDPTHVCFWSEATFHWLAHSLAARLTVIGKDVVILRKCNPQV